MLYRLNLHSQSYVRCEPNQRLKDDKPWEDPKLATAFKNKQPNDPLQAFLMRYPCCGSGHRHTVSEVCKRNWEARLKHMRALERDLGRPVVLSVCQYGRLRKVLDELKELEPVKVERSKPGRQAYRPTNDSCCWYAGMIAAARSHVNSIGVSTPKSVSPVESPVNAGWLFRVESDLGSPASKNSIIEALGAMHPQATLPTANVSGRTYWAFHMLRDVEFSAFLDLYNAELQVQYPVTDGYIWLTDAHTLVAEHRREQDTATQRWMALEAEHRTSGYVPPAAAEIPALRPAGTSSSRLPRLPPARGPKRCSRSAPQRQAAPVD